MSGPTLSHTTLTKADKQAPVFAKRLTATIQTQAEAIQGISADITE